MKYKAVLKTESRDSKGVGAALNVDNVKLHGLNIETKTLGACIITTVEANHIKTLLATLDDIICCQMVAERVIKE